MHSSARRQLLERLPEEIRKCLPSRKSKLEDFFTLLGGASAALLISTPSLHDVGELRESVGDAIASVTETDSNKLTSEIFAFPAVSLGTEFSAKLPIPIITFAKTNISLDQACRLCHNERLSNCSPMIGYGSYNVAFYSRCADLASIKDQVISLARRFVKRSSVYTIIGVPCSEFREQEKRFASFPFLFHSALKVRTIVLSKRFMKEVKSIIKNPEIATHFKGIAEKDIIGYTPGRMDLLLNFKSTCPSEALDLACRFGDIEDVVDTVTWPDFCIYQKGWG